MFCVQELQSGSHIQKYGAFYVGGESRVLFKARSEVHWEVLHDDYWDWHGWVRCVYPNQLNDVRVSQLALEETFMHESLYWPTRL